MSGETTVEGQERREKSDRLVERAADRLSRAQKRPGGRRKSIKASTVEDSAPAQVEVSAPGHPEPSADESAGAKPDAATRHSRYAELNLSRLQHRGFLTPNVDRSRTKEEFRVIKRAIISHAFEDKAARAERSNIVMVTSSLPGEGKTFTSINLAMSLAVERDCTALLVDADFTRPSVLSTLGLSAEKGLIDLLEDRRVDFADVLIRTNIDKLTLLPAGPRHSLTTELLASQRMSEVMEELSRRYRDRIVILDAPPILSTSEPNALAMHVGQILFVVEAERTSKSAVKEALGLIDTGAKIGFVLNRAKPQFGYAQFGSYYRSYVGKAPTGDVRGRRTPESA